MLTGHPMLWNSPCGDQLKPQIRLRDVRSAAPTSSSNLSTASYDWVKD